MCVNEIWFCHQEHALAKLSRDIWENQDCARSARQNLRMMCISMRLNTLVYLLYIAILLFATYDFVQPPSKLLGGKHINDMFAPPPPQHFHVCTPPPQWSTPLPFSPWKSEEIEVAVVIGAWWSGSGNRHVYFVKPIGVLIVVQRTAIFKVWNG